MTVPTTPGVVCCPRALLLSTEREEFLRLFLPLHCELPAARAFVPFSTDSSPPDPGPEPHGGLVPVSPLRPSLRLTHKLKKSGVRWQSWGHGPGCGPLPSTLVQILRVLWSDKIHHWGPFLRERRMPCHGQDTWRTLASDGGAAQQEWR